LLIPATKANLFWINGVPRIAEVCTLLLSNESVKKCSLRWTYSVWTGGDNEGIDGIQLIYMSPAGKAHRLGRDLREKRVFTD